MQTILDSIYVIWFAIYIIYNKFKRDSYMFDAFFTLLISAIENCSVWCVAVVAFERFCLVMWPTNPIIRRTASREAVIVCSSLVLFSLTLSIISNYFLSYRRRRLYKSVFDSIFSICLPLLSSLIFSAMFLRKIQTSFRRINHNAQHAMTRPSVLPIKIVVVISIFGIVVAMPLSLCNCKSYLAEHKTLIRNFIWFELLWHLNFSLKFYLYTIFIPHFRKEIIDICKKAKNKLIRN